MTGQAETDLELIVCSLMGRFRPLSVRAQAISIVQNLFADASSAETNRWLDAFGETDLMYILENSVRELDVGVVIPVSRSFSC